MISIEQFLRLLIIPLVAVTYLCAAQIASGFDQSTPKTANNPATTTQQIAAVR